MHGHNSDGENNPNILILARIRKRWPHGTNDGIKIEDEPSFDFHFGRWIYSTTTGKWGDARAGTAKPRTFGLEFWGTVAALGLISCGLFAGGVGRACEWGRYAQSSNTQPNPHGIICFSRFESAWEVSFFEFLGTNSERHQIQNMVQNLREMHINSSAFITRVWRIAYVMCGYYYFIMLMFEIVCYALFNVF